MIGLLEITIIQLSGMARFLKIVLQPEQHL